MPAHIIVLFKMLAEFDLGLDVARQRGPVDEDQRVVTISDIEHLREGVDALAGQEPVARHHGADDPG